MVGSSLSLYEGNYLNGNTSRLNVSVRLINVIRLSLYEGNYLNGNLLQLIVEKLNLSNSPFMRETTWMETVVLDLLNLHEVTLSLYEGNYLNGNLPWALNSLDLVWASLPLWGKLLEWKRTSCYFLLIILVLALPLWGKLLEWKPNIAEAIFSPAASASPFMRETTWMETPLY